MAGRASRRRMVMWRRRRRLRRRVRWASMPLEPKACPAAGKRRSRAPRRCRWLSGDKVHNRLRALVRVGCSFIFFPASKEWHDLALIKSILFLRGGRNFNQLLPISNLLFCWRVRAVDHPSSTADFGRLYSYATTYGAVLCCVMYDRDLHRCHS
ncbi:hypothetical protein IWX90DRAFT_153223 [Phyllosticta citrichinensis]|uniref:Uncharacterized protein n=1 Tax=Phyllosticta citrichinensis TaxID=1130410 RepID=A0ABR1XZK1_9PEZI